MHVERATGDDLPTVEGLLRDAGLPLVGVPAAFASGVVARDGGAIVGAAALETYGPAALLRSVVVRPSSQGAGVGRALVSSIESMARGLGVDELFLLTETAADWFTRLGYEPVGRSVLPAGILASDEVTVACSVSAVTMRRGL
jgi:amino-acid N-acetyltransferase